MNATTEMLKIDEVAAELKVGKRTVEGWLADKSLSHFEVGRNVRISREELTRFVLANTKQAKRPTWLTREIETEFTKQLREMVTFEIQQHRQVAGSLS